MNSDSGIRYRSIGSVVEVFPVAADHAPLCTRDSATQSTSSGAVGIGTVRVAGRIPVECPRPRGRLGWSLVHLACARHHGDPRWTAYIYPGFPVALRGHVKTSGAVGDLAAALIRAASIRQARRVDWLTAQREVSPVPVSLGQRLVSGEQVNPSRRAHPSHSVIVSRTALAASSSKVITQLPVACGSILISPPRSVSTTLVNALDPPCWVQSAWSVRWMPIGFVFEALSVLLVTSDDSERSRNSGVSRWGHL
jgi:hypothetical protein